MKGVKRLLSVVLCLCLLAALAPSTILPASAEEPWLWPVDGIYEMYRGYYPEHLGLDIMAPMYTPVRATKSGTVIESANNCPHENFDLNPRCEGHPCNDGYGNYVVLKHEDGTYSRYLHLSQDAVLEAGTHVDQGDVIGISGSSGNSSGAHLHFDCYDTGFYRINNNPTDPRHRFITDFEGFGISYIYEISVTETVCPDNVSVAVDKPVHSLGDAVVITFAGDNADHFSCRVLFENNGSSAAVYTNLRTLTDTIVFCPPKKGNYIVRVTAYGSSGDSVDAECAFTVVKDPANGPAANCYLL